MEYFEQYHEDVFRCTGRSIRLACDYLKAMSLQPSEWIKITDHHPSSSANRHLVYMVSDIANALRLAIERKQIGETYYLRLIP